MSFIQSAFTPAGTNAKRSQENQQKEVANQAYDLLQQISPALKQQATYSAGNETSRQAALNRSILEASPGKEAANLATFQNQAYDSAARAAKQAAQLSRASGVSGALAAGQNQAITNDAQRATNNQASYYASPEYHAQQAARLYGLYNEASSMPQLNTLQGLASTIYGRPSVMVQPGIGQVVGKIAGDYLGGQMGGGGAAASQASSGGVGASDLGGGGGYHFGAGG